MVVRQRQPKALIGQCLPYPKVTCVCQIDVGFWCNSEHAPLIRRKLKAPRTKCFREASDDAQKTNAAPAMSFAAIELMQNPAVPVLKDYIQG
jgi:hypothetical protein